MSGFEISRRGFLTVSTAVGLSGFYGLYAHFVNPLVTPETLRAAGGSDPGTVLPPPDSLHAAERWLPSQPWAARAAYQLRTDEAFVYFDEWESTDSDEAVRLKPFALVWMTDDSDADGEPIRITCDSAYLRFEGEFKIPNANPGRVVGGSLEGNVRILGKDGLDVVGKNFIFSESAMRVWSDNHVKFTHGPHRGEAMQLQIELIPDESAAPHASVAVSGIKSVRLRRNVVMDLQLGDALPSAENQPPASPGDARPPTPVRIRCDGSFTFVTETNVATYEDNVRVLKPVGPDDYDTLECETLTLTFEPDENTEKAADAPSKSPRAAARGKSPKKPGPQPEEEPPRFQGISGKLTFRRLLAEGKKVLLTSRANDMRARMTRLKYDAADGIAILSDKKNVRVLQGESELNAPEIELKHDEEGAAKSLWCRGAGWLQYHDAESAKVQLHATWVKQLRKYPDPNSKLDVIELEQQAVVGQPLQQSGLAADFIKLWLEPQEATESPRAAFPSPRAASRGNSQQMRIDRLLALKNVAMINPQLHADTDRLEVWFEPAELAPRPAPAAEPQPVVDKTTKRGTAPPLPDEVIDAAAPPAPVAASGGTVGKRADAPVADAEQGQAKPFAPAATTSAADADLPPAAASAQTRPPTVVTSDRIQARILHDSQRQESQVAEIWTFGNVEVTQQGAANDEPLKITGDTLHMQNQSETDQLVHVFGEPAHIRDPQMHIQGNNVHLDRRRNRAWVDGEGLLQLPVSNDMEGNPLPAPELLDVAWRDQMTFDGEKARFRGDVVTSIQHSRMRCREMEVLLTDRISFAEAVRDEGREAAGRPEVDVRRIDCKGGVDVESRELAEQQLVQVRRARFSDLTINQTTGDQLANGPGWIAVWRKAEANRPGFSNAATVQANKPLQHEAVEWEYSRIDFAGKSVGNMKQRTTTFNDRVQVVHGPIDKLFDVVDADAGLPDNGGWMRCAKLDVTHFESSDARPAYLTLLGSGNAELEGRVPIRNQTEARSEKFRGRADTISFDQSKGLYILRSHGTRTATVWRQRQVGGDPSQHDAKRMEFIPALNHLKSHSTTGTIGIE